MAAVVRRGKSRQALITKVINFCLTVVSSVGGCSPLNSMDIIRW